jgi:hypothetical protein
VQDQADKSTQTSARLAKQDDDNSTQSPTPADGNTQTPTPADEHEAEATQAATHLSASPHLRPSSSRHTSADSSRTDNTLVPPKRTTARSGSITENIVESRRGVRKVVLETSGGSNDENDEDNNAAVASSPETPKHLLGKLFSSSKEHLDNGKVEDKDGKKAEEGVTTQSLSAVEEGEETVTSPETADDGDNDGAEEEAQSPTAASGSASKAGGSKKKKKNQRKKRKGGKS